MNGLNQYTSAGPASFTYDANGNLITDGTWVYTYDVENRLVHATGKDVYVSYDPLGRLVELSGGGIGDVYFLDDGDALVAEYAVSTGGMTNRYVHGSNAAADVPLVWYEGSIVNSAYRQLLHTDQLGSIVVRTNGGAPAINSYDEYGIPATNNSGRFGYTGRHSFSRLGSITTRPGCTPRPSSGSFRPTPSGIKQGSTFMNMRVMIRSIMRTRAANSIAQTTVNVTPTPQQ